jgi:G3E family GTPase
MTRHTPLPGIPVTLLTGFLGSGKTTLLNHLVRQPEMADALVIINEFGEVALDHLLVAHSTETVVTELGNGCVCCSIRGDLVKTLRDITWRFARDGRRQFQRVLIETTGLADPAPIIHTLMSHPQITPKYRFDGIVVTLDLATGMNTLDAHPEAIKQAAMADLLVLTKSDLVDASQRQSLLERLSALNPGALRRFAHPGEQGEVAARDLLNLGLYQTDGKIADVARWLKEEAYSQTFVPVPKPDGSRPKAWALKPALAQTALQKTPLSDNRRHQDPIRAFCFTVEQPIPEVNFSFWLEVLKNFLGSHILRVKGIVNIEGNPLPVVVQGVQHLFHPPVTLPAWPSDDRRSRFVFITNAVDRDMIEKTFALFRESPQAIELPVADSLPG